MHMEVRGQLVFLIPQGPSICFVIGTGPFTVWVLPIKARLAGPRTLPVSTSPVLGFLVPTTVLGFFCVDAGD